MKINENRENCWRFVKMKIRLSFPLLTTYLTIYLPPFPIDLVPVFARVISPSYVHVTCATINLNFLLAFHSSTKLHIILKLRLGKKRIVQLIRLQAHKTQQNNKIFRWILLEFSIAILPCNCYYCCAITQGYNQHLPFNSIVNAVIVTIQLICELD